MDYKKIGELICQLRKEKGLTQLQLAEKLHVSDKAVSKWERGIGCPDVSILNALANELNINVDKLLSGEIEINSEAIKMNKIKFFVCDKCGSVFTATGAGEISCCGKKLSPLVPQEADAKHRLNVEKVEDEFYLTSDHPMTKDHYIAFVAQVNFDRVNLVKTYAEQSLGLRFPQTGDGYFCYYCTNDGFYKFKP